jgi:hypothetical protein
MPAVMTTEREWARAVRGRPRRGVTGRLGSALAVFVLEGLSTTEVLAVALVVPAVMGLLWATRTVAPERLISDPGFRAAWILLVLALLRPLTWIPYLIPFVAFRRLFDVLLPARREMLRNGLAHLVTVAILAATVWLVVAAVQGAGTAILSGLAFATGSGSFDTLGSFRGDWTNGRIAILVGVVILVRLFLPPFGGDLDLSREPVLGFPSGARGTFDRYVLLVAVAASVAIALAAFLIEAS